MVELKGNKIVFECEKCGVTLRIDADSPPKKGRCPQCGHRIEIPSKQEAERGRRNRR